MRALIEVPRHMAEALALEPQIEQLARDLAKSRDVLYLGRGTSYPLALEGALKLKEISYIHAEGYAAGELKHGPIALIDETMPVIVIAPLRPRVREDRLEHAGGGGARRAHHPGHRSEGRARGDRSKSLATITLPDMPATGDAAGLCGPGAAHRLPHGGGHGHRRRPAAQPGEIGDGGVTDRGTASPRRDLQVTVRAVTTVSIASRSTTEDTGRPPAAASVTGQSPTESPPPSPASAAGIRNYFLTGLIVAGPLCITIYLIWSFVNWVDDLVRPFIPEAYRPETYLPVKIPGSGLIIAFVALTLLGFLTANLVGRTLVEFGETSARAHADRAADLREPEAGLRDAVLQTGSSFRKVGAGRVPVARHVVAGVSVAAAELRHRRRGCPARTSMSSVFMPCTPNPTTGFLLLRAAQRHDRARHHGRGGREADHVGRHDAAATAISRRSSPRWPRPPAPRARHASTRAGEVTGICRCRDSCHPARISRTASSRSNR